MNHHWLEDQKMRANKARYREAGHDQESPSDYIIRKLELLKLVYSYTETETIKAIMSEVPDAWTSIINPQYTKTLLDFQNSVKYHGSLLRNWAIHLRTDMFKILPTVNFKTPQQI